MANLQLQQKHNLSSMRKLALGTWRTTYDPSVYGSMTIRMDAAMEYLQAFREKTGKKLTVTHLMAKAMGGVLEKMPDANAIMRFNRIYLRKQIGVFFQVAMADPKTGEIDLSGITVLNPEQKTTEAVYDEFSAQVKKVRAYKDEKLEQTRGLIKRLPYFMLKPFVWTIGFLSYTLNLDLRWLNIPKDAFGSVMITNIGSLGLEEAYVPLVPYSRVPLLLAMGPVQDTPVVENGEVVIAKTMKLYATFDHRILDGSHAAVMSRVLQKWFASPFEYFDPLEDKQMVEVDAPASSG